jgi:alpha-1,6-mannosyltransferase
MPQQQPALPSTCQACDERPHLLDASMFWMPGGGVQQALQTKRRFLQGLGWRHTLLAPGVQGAGRIDCGGLRLPASGGYRFVLRRAPAARLMAQARPDLIEAADPYTLGWAVLDAAARLQVPAVAFCHSNLPALAARLAGGTRPTRRGHWAAQAARRYLAGLYARYDLLLAPSLSMTRQLHGWGLPQALHQPLGVDCAVFRPHPPDPPWRARLERQLQVPPGTRLLVYAGRFAPEKNLDVLAAAVQRLGPGHVLLAVGAGPSPPVGDHVRLFAPEPDRARLARLLAGCDAFVHAGDQETFGLAALEAMACGTPVVVAQAGGLGELAQGVGITVQGRQPGNWADGMAAGLEEAGRRPPAAALERARAHDWPRVLAQWCRHYERSLGVRPGLPAPAARAAAATGERADGRGG